MKHDCVFGDDLDINEISFVSEVSCSTSLPLPPATHFSPSITVTSSVFCLKFARWTYLMLCPSPGSEATWAPHIVFSVSWNQRDPSNGQGCERTSQYVPDNWWWLGFLGRCCGPFRCYQVKKLLFCGQESWNEGYSSIIVSSPLCVPFLSLFNRKKWLLISLSGTFLKLVW